MLQLFMTAQPKVGNRPWAATAFLLSGAIVLGVFADLGQRLPGGWAQLPELGTPWVVGAFLSGRLWAPRWGAAVLAGVGFIATALASYFVFMHLWHGVGYYNLLNDGRGQYWSVMATVLGTTATVAGCLSRSHGRQLRAVGWGFLPALPLAESLFIALRGGPDPIFVLTALAVTAVALTTWAWQHSRHASLMAAISAWVALGLVAVPLAVHLI